MQPHKKPATDYSDKNYVFIRVGLWLNSVERLLGLNDLYARIELDIKLAFVDLLVLFQTSQTHRG